MRKITLTLLLALSALPLLSQTNTTITLIDPAGDGGFETGATFEANGWVVVNPTSANTNRRWYVGTGQSGFSGNRSAFIGNNETTVGTPTGARTVHFYRSVTFPDNAANIVLTFKYKQETSDFVGGTYYDYIVVKTSNAVPVNGTVPAGAVQFGPFPNAPVTTYATQTVTLPGTLAGTTRNLIFTYDADSAAAHGYGAIDDISLTYDTVMGSDDLYKSSLVYYPNPVKDILTINNDTAISSVAVYNILGQQVLFRQVNNTETKLDTSSLTPGSYMARVTVGDAVQNIKIIKQ
jgi:hypothetical protein